MRKIERGYRVLVFLTKLNRVLNGVLFTVMKNSRPHKFDIAPQFAMHEGAIKQQHVSPHGLHVLVLNVDRKPLGAPDTARASIDMCERGQRKNR